MLHILDRLITLKHFVKPLLFEGGMSSAKRDKAVRRFQSDPACQVPLRGGPCCKTPHHLRPHDVRPLSWMQCGVHACVRRSSSSASGLAAWA